MDLLTSTWHTMNNQMDYIDDRSSTKTTATCAGDTTNDLSLRQPSMTTNILPQQSSLTNDAARISQQYFYAFDSEHVGSWNVSDLDRALQYLFYHQKRNKSPSHIDSMNVERLFQQYATPVVTTTTRIPTSFVTNKMSFSGIEPRRLYYREYLQLLHHVYQCTTPG
jgi:hypothetical protein